MTNQTSEIPEEVPYTKDEILMIVHMLRMNNMQITYTLEAVCKMLGIDDNFDMVMCQCGIIERVKSTMIGETDVWLEMELATEQLIKDAI